MGKSLRRSHRHRTPTKIMNQSDHSMISLLLIVGLFLAGTTTTIVAAQPTFSECKIFLVASDTARDLSLNKEPEYIRFLNLVARTFLIAHDFDTYDALPLELQTTYKAYAWTAEQEVDISAAMFGAPATRDQLLVLEAFCNETSQFIASTVEETESPTWAPTAVPFDVTEVPTSLAPLTFDVESVEPLPGTSAAGAITELPIQCRRSMFGSDADRDGFLTEEEYTTFANRLSTNAYAHVARFLELPQELQDNFHRLAEDGQLNVFGAIPSQWAEVTRQQQQLLQLICYRTEAALVAAHEGQQSNQTQTQTPIPIETAAPTTDAPVIASGNETSSPTPMISVDNQTSTNTTVDSSGEEEHKERKDKLDKNVIAAIVGSILIAMLGIYLAKDKTDIFREKVSNFRIRCSRVRPQMKGPASCCDATRFSKASLEGEPKVAGPVSSDPYDIESLQTEQTGFLEDQRIGALSSVEEEAPIDGEFERVRFNPDEYIPKTGESGADHAFNGFDNLGVTDEEELHTDDFEDYDFEDYDFDNDDDDDNRSDDMSLYCNSVAGEANQSAAPQKAGKLNSFMGGEAKNEGSFSTEATDLMTEVSSLRRSPGTQYHASRFGRIAESESKPRPSRQLHPLDSTVKAGQRRRQGQPNQNPRHARQQTKRRQSPRRRASQTKNEHNSAEENKPSFCTQKQQETPMQEFTEPVNRFLKYARDEPDSSETSSDVDSLVDNPSTVDSDGDFYEGEELSLGLEETPYVSDTWEDQEDEESDNVGCGRLGEDHSDVAPDRDIEKMKSHPKQLQVPNMTPNSSSDIVDPENDKTESSAFLDTTDSSSSFQDLSGRHGNDKDFDIGSEGDSTYEGTETASSFDIPEASSESEQADNDSMHSNVQEIQRLVAKVMPTESGNVNRMLVQYKGREDELLNTLRRLEARVDTKRASGRPIHVSPDPASAAACKRLEQKALLARASVMAENAELLAAAVSFGPGQIHGIKSPYNNNRGAADDESCKSSDEESAGGGIHWGPSTDIDEDEFSKDSTYFEDQAPTANIRDDESVSLFSV